MSKKKIIVITLLFFIFSLSVFSSDYLIIVSKDNNITELSSKDLREIFLGDKITWKNGKRIQVAIVVKSEAQNEFLKNVVKKSPLQFSLHWKKLIFTGKASPIRIFKNCEVLKEFIYSNSFSIGIITRNETDPFIKEIKVIKEKL